MTCTRAVAGGREGGRRPWLCVRALSPEWRAAGQLCSYSRRLSTSGLLLPLGHSQPRGRYPELLPVTLANTEGERRNISVIKVRHFFLSPKWGIVFILLHCIFSLWRKLDVLSEQEKCGDGKIWGWKIAKHVMNENNWWFRGIHLHKQTIDTEVGNVRRKRERERDLCTYVKFNKVLIHLSMLLNHLVLYLQMHHSIHHTRS